MLNHILILAASMAVAVCGTTLATRYSAKMAESFNIAKYVVGFVIVALISILPETIIAISAAIQGVPEFGLGTLFGSNVADLSLIFAIVALYSSRGIRVESKVLGNVRWYPIFLLLPLIFGLNGHYSRVEGVALILAGVFFYYSIFKGSVEKGAGATSSRGRYKNLFILLASIAMLLVGSHYVVVSAKALAISLNITPILIGLLVVSLGTTMPELMYSLKAVRRRDDSLAIGDILGSVLADATIVVGILALVKPFEFPSKIVYITGAFMLVSSLVLIRLMRSGRTITRREGAMLLAFWVIYATVEIFLNS